MESAKGVIAGAKYSEDALSGKFHRQTILCAFFIVSRLILNGLIGSAYVTEYAFLLNATVLKIIYDSVIILMGILFEKWLIVYLLMRKERIEAIRIHRLMALAIESLVTVIVLCMIR